MEFGNIKFTFRNFRKQKLFTFVNLAGLTLGIVSTSLIFIYVGNELSYDRFNKNADRIFRVYGTFTRDGADEAWVQTPAPLAPFLQNKFPEIAKTVRIASIPKCLISSGDKSFFENRMIMADSSIFDVFTFPLISGNIRQVLSRPNSIVLTVSAAEKYFGKNDPVGKIIRYNREKDLVVTGVMKNIPGNTHLHFDMIVSMSSAKSLLWSDFLENPMNTVVSTYLLTNQNTDVEKFNSSVSQSAKEYDGGADFGDNKQYRIQPLTSIHLLSDMGGESSPNGDIKSVYILSTIAIMIMLIACINYINLSFSIIKRRSTELGLRKIMGARKRQLIFLYLQDAFVLAGISVIISIVIIPDLLQWFGSLVGVDLSGKINIGSLIPVILLLFIIITLITGIGSGWISTKINPMDTLRKTLIHRKKHIGIQGILVLFQFGVSIALISSSLIVYRQMSFVRNINLGFSKEQLIIIPLDDKTILSKIIPFKQDLSTNANILSSSAVSDLPGEMKWVTSINYDGMNQKSPSTMTFLEIDRDFIKTFGIQLKNGYIPGDTACPYSGTQYLMNESAVKKLGWDIPVGKKLSSYNGKDGFVTGIVEDFHFKTLHKEIEPLFLYVREVAPKYLAVKLNTTDINGSVDFIKHQWNNIVPDSPFEYFFYDSYYDQLYKKEALFGRIIFIFSVVAILIACLGLFGLAAFFSERRTKEIGIRKVNGAVIGEVLIMLNREFIKWVLIAFIIATPASWYLMHKWLQNFAYKTELSWWIFGLAGMIAFVIAVMTVTWQSWRAATKNPVEALRYE
jgi:putative ABC transport system permease protein